MRRLRTAGEEAKRMLSAAVSASVEVNCSVVLRVLTTVLPLHFGIEYVASICFASMCRWRISRLERISHILYRVRFSRKLMLRFLIAQWQLWTQL